MNTEDSQIDLLENDLQYYLTVYKKGGPINWLTPDQTYHCIQNRRSTVIFILRSPFKGPVYEM